MVTRDFAEPVDWVGSDANQRRLREQRDAEHRAARAQPKTAALPQVRAPSYRRPRRKARAQAAPSARELAQALAPAVAEFVAATVQPLIERITELETAIARLARTQAEHDRSLLQIAARPPGFKTTSYLHAPPTREPGKHVTGTVVTPLEGPDGAPSN